MSNKWIELVKNGDLTGLKRLVLEDSISLNERGDSDTPLTLAVKGNQKKVVEWLLEYGVDLNVKDEWHETALLIAIEAEHLEVAQLLIEKGADLDSQNSRRRTALMLAIETGLWEMVQLLVEKGVNLDVQDALGMTALMLAIKTRHFEMVRLLIESGADIHLQNTYGKNALMELVTGPHFIRGDMEIDFDLEKVRFNLVQLFVRKGINLDVQDNEGNTALIKAVYMRHLEIAQFLVARGANLHLQNKYGWNVLDYAIGLHRSDLFSTGWEVTDHEVESHSLDLIQLFIEKGLNLDSQDKRGRTALMRQCQSSSGSLMMVRMLVDMGANINLKGKDGLNALEIAKEAREMASEAIVELLKFLMYSDVPKVLLTEFGYSRATALSFFDFGFTTLEACKESLTPEVLFQLCPCDSEKQRMRLVKKLRIRPTTKSLSVSSSSKKQGFCACC